MYFLLLYFCSLYTALFRWEKPTGIRLALLPHQNATANSHYGPSTESCNETSVLSTTQGAILMHPGTASVFPGAIYDKQALLGHNSLRHIPQIQKEKSRKTEDTTDFLEQEELTSFSSYQIMQLPTALQRHSPSRIDTSIPNTVTLLLICFSRLLRMVRHKPQ